MVILWTRIIDSEKKGENQGEIGNIQILTQRIDD